MSPKRVDANQAEIVAALRAIGCSVEIISEVGRGVPDLLVGYGVGLSSPLNYLIEVKAEGGTLTPAQVEWHACWRGQVATVWDVDGALAVVCFRLADVKRGRMLP